MHEYFVYILRCRDGSYYTGVTNDYKLRLEQHQLGEDPDCYTFRRRPVKLVYMADFQDVNEAISWEKKLKRWSRVKKEALIRREFESLPKLAECKNETHHRNFHPSLPSKHSPLSSRAEHPPLSSRAESRGDKGLRKNTLPWFDSAHHDNYDTSMKENSSLAPDLQEFYTELQKSFANLFAHQHCQQDIAEVIEALEQKRPIADLVQSPRGSFSTIFLPFHSGRVHFQTIAKSRPLYPKLLKFCELAGKIESLTDTMGITGEEPSKEDKAKLLPLLKVFLIILPSQEEFDSWLQ